MSESPPARLQLVGDDDRTFKGYELYAGEVERQRAADKAKLAKYKELETVTVAVFIAGLLMLAAASALFFLAPACNP